MADSHSRKDGKITLNLEPHVGDKDTHLIPCNRDLCTHYITTLFHKAADGKGDHIIRLHISDFVDCEHTDTTGLNELRSNLGAGTKCPLG